MPLKGEALHTAIDLRLHDIWGETIDIPPTDLDTLGVFMRAAYARGYTDALKDDGAFMRDELGYPLPVEAGRAVGGSEPDASAGSRPASTRKDNHA